MKLDGAGRDRFTQWQIPQPHSRQRAQVRHNTQVDPKARVCDTNVYFLRIINYPKELFGRRKVVELELDNGAARRERGRVHVSTHIPHQETAFSSPLLKSLRAHRWPHSPRARIIGLNSWPATVRCYSIPFPVL